MAAAAAATTTTGTAGAPNGRGQKTKQTTLFGLPAVPAPERPEKRTRKKGGAAPSEDASAAEPETMESQDVEMVELQDVAATQTSQGGTATAVDSQQESQATEVITTQVKRVSPVYAVLKLTTTRRKMAVLSLSIGLQRHHHRWKIITSQMRYVLTECYTALTDSYVMFPSTEQTHCHTSIFPFHQIGHDILRVPLVGDERVYVQVLCERGQRIQFTT